jgi:nicotinamidase-related amidase
MNKTCNHIELLLNPINNGSRENPRYSILVVDMLYDFIYGKLQSPRARKIIPKIKYLLEFAREKRIPIFYCNDAHLSSDPEIKLWGLHAMKGTRGADVIKEIKPTKKDYQIPKRGYSAFDQMKLESALHSTYNRRGTTALIITGIHTHLCVKHSTYDAFRRGYDTIIVEDAVSAFSKKDHVFALKYMKENYGSKINKTSQIIKAINKQDNL